MLAHHIRQFIGLKKNTNYFILYIMFVGHILYLNCIVPSLIKRCNNSFLYVVVCEDCDCSYNLICIDVLATIYSIYYSNKYHVSYSCVDCGSIKNSSFPIKVNGVINIQFVQFLSSIII